MHTLNILIEAAFSQMNLDLTGKALPLAENRQAAEKAF